MLASASTIRDARHPNAQARPLAIRVGDARVQIDGLPPALRVRLRDLVRPFVTRSAAAPAIRVQVRPAPSGSGWVVVYEGQALRVFDTCDTLLTYLEWVALTQAVGKSTVLAFHAAALSRGESTLLLLGKSGAGKTTLTLGLMARGWQPLADDVVLVNPSTLAIEAFPRCFHVDNSTKDLVAGQVALEWPGKLDGYARPTVWAPGGQPATTIMVVNRCPTCMAARFPLMQAEGAAGLLAEAAGTQLAGREVARTAARIASGATCFRLKNGPLEGALNLIERACER